MINISKELCHALKIFQKYFVFVFNSGISEDVSLAFDEKFADADWHRLDNTNEHRTNYYNSPTLILRRGQPFKFTARLNRPFEPSTDKIKLQLRFGSSPDLRLGTGMNKEEQE